MGRRRTKPGRKARARRAGVGDEGHRGRGVVTSAAVRSGTAVAAEALRTGLLPATARRRLLIPHEDETIRFGDPDNDSLANEYVGEDVPGGSTPTPDQSSVDAIGRAYGLQDEDNGTLRTSAEVLARRDRHRPELRPPSRPRS